MGLKIIPRLKKGVWKNKQVNHDAFVPDIAGDRTHSVQALKRC